LSIGRCRVDVLVFTVTLRTSSLSFRCTPTIRASGQQLRGLFASATKTMLVDTINTRVGKGEKGLSLPLDFGVANNEIPPWSIPFLSFLKGWVVLFDTPSPE